MHLKRVMIVRVLISIRLSEVMIAINCRHNIQMVVGSIRVRGVLHVVEFLVVVQFCKHRLWMLAFDSFYVLDVAEVQLVDYVAYV